MHEAAQALVGMHDFSAFRAAGCQASSPDREIRAIEVKRQGDWIRLEVTANAFLQHMVRNITGSLMAVGCGDESVAWLSDVLQSRDRKRAGIAAPPHGLTLIHVEYPAEFSIPLSPTDEIASFA
jgi:tRNA pseudouridine38-40 synthase